METIAHKDGCFFGGGFSSIHYVDPQKRTEKLIDMAKMQLSDDEQPKPIVYKDSVYRKTLCGVRIGLGDWEDCNQEVNCKRCLKKFEKLERCDIETKKDVNIMWDYEHNCKTHNCKWYDRDSMPKECTTLSMERQKATA